MPVLWLFASAGSVFASVRPEGALMPVPILERHEHNADTPFRAFREKSSQRIIYTRKTSHLVTEINYRRVMYSDYLGEADEKNYLYHASFRGYNMSSPLEFKVGRIMTGNNNIQTIDGGSWFYPFTDRLSMNFDVGKIAAIDSENSNRPSFAEGRTQYYLNDNSYMAIKAVQRYDEKSAGLMIGYDAEGLRAYGEYLNGSATDSWQLALSYISEHGFDLNADYILFQNDIADSAIMRHYAGYETGNLYFELGGGNNFTFNNDDDKNNWFYEGSFTWGVTDSDNLTFGSIHETTYASSSRTIFAQAERRISRNTRLSVGVEDTKFEKAALSFQNLHASLWRRVQWGYYELRGAMISGGTDSNLQKDVRLSAGYEF